MKTMVFFSACALSAIFVAGLLAGPPAAQQTQQEKKEFHSPEMDGLIKAIHADLMELKKTQPWLAEYDDKNLYDTEISYYYTPASREKSERLVQQPSHIWIAYRPIDENNGKVFKYYNSLEQDPACSFPTLKLRVCAEIGVHDGAKVAEAIRKCIIKQCEALHKKMDAEKEKAAKK